LFTTDGIKLATHRKESFLATKQEVEEQALHRERMFLKKHSNRESIPPDYGALRIRVGTTKLEGELRGR
jgi:hypothetical protein